MNGTEIQFCLQPVRRLVPFCKIPGISDGTTWLLQSLVWNSASGSVHLRNIGTIYQIYCAITRKTVNWILVAAKSQILHTHTHRVLFVTLANTLLCINKSSVLKQTVLNMQVRKSEWMSLSTRDRLHLCHYRSEKKNPRKMKWVRMCSTADYHIYAVRLGTHPRLSRPSRTYRSISQIIVPVFSHNCGSSRRR
jgi:hypothetical protein